MKRTKPPKQYKFHILLNTFLSHNPGTVHCRKFYGVLFLYHQSSGQLQHIWPSLKLPHVGYMCMAGEENISYISQRQWNLSPATILPVKNIPGHPGRLPGQVKPFGNCEILKHHHFNFLVKAQSPSLLQVSRSTLPRALANGTGPAGEAWLGQNNNNMGTVLPKVLEAWWLVAGGGSDNYLGNGKVYTVSLFVYGFLCLLSGCMCIWICICVYISVCV